MLSFGAESLAFNFLSKIIKLQIYKIIILPVVLYGCENWSLKNRVEHSPRVFANRVLSMVLGPKRDDVAGDWRRLHNEELYDLNSSRMRGTRWSSLLRHWPTSRKVVGLISDGIIGVHSSDSTMTLGSTHLLREMSTRDISWG